MSVDVEREIRAYAAYLDEILPTVAADYVRTATVPTPLGPPRANRSEPSWYRRPITVFAAAVVGTFVVLGSLILLAPFSEQDAVTVTDPPVVTVPPVVTTTTAAPFVGPVGAFEWEMHELSEFITYPARWSSGYVALRGNWVVSSVDGIKWDEWPEQPADLADRALGQLALVVDDGDVVVIVAQSSAPLRALASNEGRTWRELTFEPGELADPGRPLDVITNPDDGLYVQLRETYLRQGDSFVATPLPGDLAHGLSWDQATRSWNGIALPDQTLTVGERRPVHSVHPAGPRRDLDVYRRPEVAVDRTGRRAPERNGLWTAGACDHPAGRRDRGARMVRCRKLVRTHRRVVITR